MNRRAFLIAALCVVVQYYDYYLFGFLAAKVSHCFFADGDSMVQLLKTYAVMAVAVLAKPLGAMLLGRIGDLYGRMATVVMSLSGTAAASCVIALTPSYESIGILSAVLLLLSRMAVTALVSSGTDGVRIYIYERIGANRKCFGSSIVSVLSQCGILLASLSAAYFTRHDASENGWRIAFLLGTFMGIVVVVLRMKNPHILDAVDTENDTYKKYQNTNVFAIIKENFALFFKCVMVAGCIGSSYNFVITFFGTYNSEILKVHDAQQMELIVSCGIVLYMIFAVIGGTCADRFGYRIVALYGGVAVFLLSIALAYSISLNYLWIAGYLLITVALPFLTMPALTILKQSLPTVIRYRMFSFAHAFGSITLSAPTLFISTYLYRATDVLWAPMLYFMLVIGGGVVSLYLLTSSRQRMLLASDKHGLQAL